MKYLQPLIAISRNTLKETIRDRILYVFVLFAFLVTLTGNLLGSLSVGQDLRVLEDVGLATIVIIGGIIAIFVGTSLVFKEIDRKTIYLIVTKPISRWQFVTGKFIGLSLCMLMVTLLMGGFLLAVIAAAAHDHTVNPLLIEAVGLIYLELVFVEAVATFFSTFATPLMSVVFTLSLWLIGHMGESLRQLGKLSNNEFLKNFLDAVYWLIPDLSRLTQIRSDLMYKILPANELMFYLLAYIVAYIVLLLSVSTVIIERREFA